MKPSKKSGTIARIIIITVLFGILLVVQCKNNSRKDIDCDHINEKSALFLKRFYMDSSRNYLDSAMAYTDSGLVHCIEYKNILSLRKLSILSEQHDYTHAILFINTLDNNMVPELPYYKDLLSCRFKAMKAMAGGNLEVRNKYLSDCLSLLDQFLMKKKYKVDSLLKDKSMEDILNDPLSTTITQYYFYKAIRDGQEQVKKELLKKTNEKNINKDFLKYLNDYIQTNFMEFNGI